MSSALVSTTNLAPHHTGYRCVLRLCNTPALQENQLALFSCYVHKRVTETVLSCMWGNGHRQL